ncbi:hypothetical protein [Mycobacterium alsense]|uniref:hypothetical protein n=1 Tax=Mycobacterium alsense TaxID=324058 RepID=UPI0021F3AFE5|nr:hypothetical protein [Mycobacterium alsense]
MATKADTWSAAGGATPVVGGATTAFDVLIEAPMSDKLSAAAISNSGCVVTNDTLPTSFYTATKRIAWQATSNPFAG